LSATAGYCDKILIAADDELTQHQDLSPIALNGGVLMKRFVIACFIIIAVLSCVFFITSVNEDYDHDIGGIYQLKAINYKSEDTNSIEIEIPVSRASYGKINPKIQVLSEDEPVYMGEGQIIDKELGRYRLAVTFTDTRLQKDLVKEYGHSVRKDKGNGKFLKAVRVAYPADDSTMVIYFGFDSKPDFMLEETDKSIVINVKC